MKRFAMVLALVAMSGCVAVRYQRAGDHISPRAGQTLLYGRIRFFHDGREFLPWNVSLGSSGVAARTERHLWLLRLGRRAVSAELHPDEDGTLAIWLDRGDYALLGSTEIPTSGSAPYEVIALVRVPAGAVAAYAGDLILTTQSHEGGYPSRGELGPASVTLLPIEIARATLEQRLGTLPEPPVTSAWCAGEQVPGFNDADLAKRAAALLDGQCGDPPAPAQADTTDPARVAVYSFADSLLGSLVLGRSTVEDAGRLLAPVGGLGPARDNEVTFKVGAGSLRPRRLYTPPATMHQLYFQKDTLVLFVAGNPRGLPATRAEFMGQFPKARETRREAMWYELQVPLNDCIWRIAVFQVRNDQLESAGYARACPGGG